MSESHMDRSRNLAFAGASSGAFLVDEKLAAAARTNTSRLIAILFFQEVAWLTLNRMIESDGWVFYYTSQFRLSVYAMLIALAAFYSWGGFALCRLAPVMPRLRIGNWLVVTIFSLAIIFNVISATFLTQSARYTSGALTGTAGVIYAVSRSFSLMAMVLALKGKYSDGYKISIYILTAFSFGLFITIDGLAGAMTTSAFLFLMFRSKGWKNVIIFLSFSVIAIFIFYVGMNSKFSEIPYYLTPEFSFRWSVSRMSISAESLYKYLSGESMFNEPGSYIDLLKRSYVNRYLVITGQNFFPVYPRSVSEGFYMDMYREVGAGSSPGFYLGTLLHGFFSPFILFATCCIFLQMFYGIKMVFGYVDIFAITLIMKIIHANVTEYVIFFSPTTLALFAFIFASVMVPKVPRRAGTSSLAGAG